MQTHKRKPEWLKIRLPEGKHYRSIKEIVDSNHLHTICSSGKCPNIGECWKAGTATFMIAGDICTRSCRFCATKSGKPNPLNQEEPQNIAKSVQLMNLTHCVLTSVNRDDLADGGAKHWVNTINEIRKKNPMVTIEALIPDFNGNEILLNSILSSEVDIVAHNIETTKRLTQQVRSRAKYETSLQLIEKVAKSNIRSKSGFMVGLGETNREVLETIDDLSRVGCEILTIGQYLQPTRSHLPVERYVHPNDFHTYSIYAKKRGIKLVASGPLVRSSYQAEQQITEPKPKSDE